MELGVSYQQLILKAKRSGFWTRTAKGISPIAESKESLRVPVAEGH
jgi:hypothetical protein